jgi:hypothetical protein
VITGRDHVQGQLASVILYIRRASPSDILQGNQSFSTLTVQTPITIQHGLPYGPPYFDRPYSTPRLPYTTHRLPYGTFRLPWSTSWLPYASHLQIFTSRSFPVGLPYDTLMRKVDCRSFYDKKNSVEERKKRRREK